MLQLLLYLLCSILVETLQGFPPEQLIYSTNIINSHLNKFQKILLSNRDPESTKMQV